jgi:hydrogenase nickel incorporation protein HypA/HybF
MHELSLCQALIDELEQVARAEDAERIVCVIVRVGPLAGVEPALLASAYEIASPGTVAAGARLVIETSRIRVRCLQCDAESQVESDRLACPRCGHWRTKIIAGDELLLARVELVRREVVLTEDKENLSDV